MPSSPNSKPLLFVCCLLFPLMVAQRMCCRRREPWLAPELTALLCVLLGIGNVLLGCCYSAAAANTVWLLWGVFSLLCFVFHLVLMHHESRR